MPQRREALIAAAIAVVREGGYPALTQPKVAAVAGMTQSHLTYYFPTRADLVQAVAERIVRDQFAAFDAQTLPKTMEAAIANVTALVTSTDTTRALAALMLAADVEPAAGTAFAELASGMRLRATYLLAMLAQEADAPERLAERAVDGRLLHAVAVGAAVLMLAEGEKADTAATVAMLSRVLGLLTDS